MPNFNTADLRAISVAVRFQIHDLHWLSTRRGVSPEEASRYEDRIGHLRAILAKTANGELSLECTGAEDRRAQQTVATASRASAATAETPQHSAAINLVRVAIRSGLAPYAIATEMTRRGR